MFGIPWQDIVSLRDKIGKDVFVVEDCAQAFGAKIEALPAGSFSDAAFYSFNRGKNLPTYEGGCITVRNPPLTKGRWGGVNSDGLAKRIEEEVSKISNAGALHTASLAFKSLAVSLSFNPYFYGLFFPFISCFKDNRVALDFETRSFSLFQSGLIFFA